MLLCALVTGSRFWLGAAGVLPVDGRRGPLRKLRPPDPGSREGGRLCDGSGAMWGVLWRCSITAQSGCSRRFTPLSPLRWPSLRRSLASLWQRGASQTRPSGGASSRASKPWLGRAAAWLSLRQQLQLLCLRAPRAQLRSQGWGWQELPLLNRRLGGRVRRRRRRWRPCASLRGLTPRSLRRRPACTGCCRCVRRGAAIHSPLRSKSTPPHRSSRRRTRPATRRHGLRARPCATASSLRPSVAVMVERRGAAVPSSTSRPCTSSRRRWQGPPRSQTRPFR